MFHSGFISVVGRPNVGKSTLINRIIGEKLTIVSDKPQTTRNKLQFIYTNEKMQAIFLDTPGIQRPRNALGQYMLKLSTEALKDMDLLLYVTDCSLELGPLEEMILEKLKAVERPIILLINKIDEVSKSHVAQVIQMFSQIRDFAAIIPISATLGDGVDLLLEEIYRLLPEGPQYFPEDMITDQPEKFIVAEIIREKTLTQLSQEVPHGVFVEVNAMKGPNKENRLFVEATIYCERESHKGIIIGKKGSMLKRIGQLARLDINRFTGAKTHLELWVKVEKNWREKKVKMENFGYR